MSTYNKTQNTPNTRHKPLLCSGHKPPPFTKHHLHLILDTNLPTLRQTQSSIVHQKQASTLHQTKADMLHQKKHYIAPYVIRPYQKSGIKWRASQPSHLSVSIQCSQLLMVTVHCDTVQYIHCNAVQCSALQYSAVPCIIIRYRV